MTGNVSATLMVWSVLVPALLVAAHVLLYRLSFHPAEGSSPQAFLAKLIAVFNIPTIVVAILFGFAEARAMGEILLMVFLFWSYSTASPTPISMYSI